MCIHLPVVWDQGQQHKQAGEVIVMSVMWLPFLISAGTFAFKERIHLRIPAYQHGRGRGSERQEVETIVKCSGETTLSKSLHDFRLVCHIPNLLNCRFLIQVLNPREQGQKGKTLHVRLQQQKRMKNGQWQKEAKKKSKLSWLLLLS